MFVAYEIHTVLISGGRITGSCWFYAAKPPTRKFRVSECLWIVPGTAE